MNPNEFLTIYFSIRKANPISRFFASLQDGISHAGFSFKLPQINKLWIWESKGHGGLSYSDPVEFEANVTVIETYQIAWTENERMIALFQMDRLLREHYGYMGVLGMTVVLICKKLGGWSENPFPTGYFCSKAVYTVLKDVFKFYVDGDPSESRIGPEDLRDLFRELIVKYPDKVKRIL